MEEEQIFICNCCGKELYFEEVDQTTYGHIARTPDKNGDIDYLRDNLILDPLRSESYNLTRAILDAIYERGNATSEELCKLYNYIYLKQLSVAAFGKLMGMYMESKQTIRVNGVPRKGFKINWK
jgi:hypothetical protein